MSEPIIRFDKVVKRFGALTVLDELDFTVGLKILFLCLLGIPYLFVQKPRFCPNCQTVWKPAAATEAVDA